MFYCPWTLQLIYKCLFFLRYKCKIEAETLDSIPKDLPMQAAVVALKERNVSTHR